jgi:MFS family permease
MQTTTNNNNNNETTTENSIDQNNVNNNNDEILGQSLWNHNTRLGFLLSFSAGIADSVWVDTVMAAFLYATIKNAGREKDDNTLVGTAEACWGIASLVSALPVGYLADRYSKSDAIRAGGVLMLIAVFVSMYGVNKGSHHETTKSEAMQSYEILLAGNVVWGVAGGVMNGPVQALFADSIPLGMRTKGYTYLMVLYLVASCLGPIISIIMFSKLDSEYKNWSTEEIRPIFLVGLAMEIGVALLMLFFRDVNIVATPAVAVVVDSLVVEEQPPTTTIISSSSSTTSNNGMNDNNRLTQPLLVHHINNNEQQQQQQNVDEELVLTTTSPPPLTTAILPPVTFCYCTITQRTIPFLLFFASLVSALGSGASVKFFPLFFEDEKFTPIQVQWIFAASPLVIALFTLMAEPLAKRLGRIQAAILLESIGIVFLLVMAILKYVEAPRGYLVPVFLLRTGFMNSTYAIFESVLMDSVPSSERSRWKSLEAVAAVGWTGSSVIGGLVADRSGEYATAFLLTASLQFIGTWMVLPLIKIIPKEQVSGKQQ